MRKVVHLSSVHPPFDTRIFAKECRSLVKAGYDVTLIIPHDNDDLCDGVQLRGIIHQGSGRLTRMIKTTWQVFQRARHEKADIYHFHDPELIPISILLAFTGAKVIYDVHEDVPRQIQAKHYLPTFVKYPLSGMVALMEWLASRLFFAGIVAATPDIAKRFPQSKTCLVQNFVDLDEFSSRHSTKLSDEFNTNILYIGALDETRGLYKMIDAMALVKTRKVRLKLAGRFSSPQLAKEIKQQTGKNHTDYIGILDRNEIGQALKNADCGIVTLQPTASYLKSYPVKLFEYMAFGLPVIASDFPLWRTLLSDYDCALFVDPKSSEDIAQAIDDLLSDPEKARRMGCLGKQAVEELYNWHQEEKKMLDFYRDLF